MPPLLLGDLPLDSDLNAELNIKRGNRQDNPRGTTKAVFKFKVDDGFEVTHAKVLRAAAGVDASINIPNNLQLFFF